LNGRCEIAGAAAPAVQRPVETLPDRRAAVRRILHPDWRRAREQSPDHFCVSVEGSPAKRLPALDAARERIKPEVDHQGDGREIVRVCPVGDQPHLPARQRGHDDRLRIDNGLRRCAIAGRAGGKQPLDGRRVPEQQVNDVVEAQHDGRIDRGDVVPEDPAIDVASTIADLLARRGPGVVVSDGVHAVPGPMIES